MSEIKRKPGKYPYRPTEKEMYMVDTFNSLLEGKDENLDVKLLNIGRAKKHILEAFEYGLSVTDVSYQNDILKIASEKWLELNAIVEQLKEEEL